MKKKQKKAQAGEKKIEKVMREFRNGTLRSSSGAKVTNRKQALAIAMSEARRAGARMGKTRNGKRVIKMKMTGRKLYGEANLDGRTIRVNRKLARKSPMKVRPITKGAHRYPDVLDTIVHEEMHMEHPKMHERTVRKNTETAIKKMTAPMKRKLYGRYT